MNTRPMMASSTPDSPMAPLLPFGGGGDARAQAHVASARESEVLRPVAGIGGPFHVGGLVDRLPHAAHEHGPVVAAAEHEGAGKAIDSAEELAVGVAHGGEILVAAQLEVLGQRILAARRAQVGLELGGELEPVP